MYRGSPSRSPASTSGGKTNGLAVIGQDGPVREFPRIAGGGGLFHFAVGSDLADDVVTGPPEVCLEFRNAIDYCEKATRDLRGVERIGHAVRSGQGTIRPLY